MKYNHFLKYRGLGVNMLASFSFLMLAVYGWGISWEDLGRFLLICLALLSGLLVIAAILGWLLGVVSKWREK